VKKTMELDILYKKGGPLVVFWSWNLFIFAAKVNLQKILISIKFVVKKIG